MNTNVEDLEEMYYDLVWYARKKKDKNGKLNMELAFKNYPETPGDILITMVENVNRIYEMYPDEIPKNDFQHGFNCGMLAALRLFRKSIKISAKKLEEFPNLDT